MQKYWEKIKSYISSDSMSKIWSWSKDHVSWFPVGLLCLIGIANGSFVLIIASLALCSVLYECHKIKKKIENGCWY